MSIDPIKSGNNAVKIEYLAIVRSQQTIRNISRMCNYFWILAFPAEMGEFKG